MILRMVFILLKDFHAPISWKAKASDRFGMILENSASFVRLDAPIRY